MLSFAKILWCEMVGLLNSEVERMWKEVFVAQ
jgi:hypothetical protein